MFTFSYFSGYGTYTGQNLKWDGGSKNWTNALYVWFEEYKDLQWGVHNNKMVGHYTQVHCSVLHVI